MLWTSGRQPSHQGDARRRSGDRGWNPRGPEETTFDGYRGYIRRTRLGPRSANVDRSPRSTPQVLEEFYADLRRVCRHLCRNGEPAYRSPHDSGARLPHRAAPPPARPPGAGAHDCRLRRCRMHGPHRYGHGRVVNPADPRDPQLRPRRCSSMGVDQVALAHRCRPVAASRPRSCGPTRTGAPVTAQGQSRPGLGHAEVGEPVESRAPTASRSPRFRGRHPGSLTGRRANADRGTPARAG